MTMLVVGAAGPDVRCLERAGRVASGNGAATGVCPDQRVPELCLALACDDVPRDPRAGVGILACGGSATYRARIQAASDDAQRLGDARLRIPQINRAPGREGHALDSHELVSMLQVLTGSDT